MTDEEAIEILEERNVYAKGFGEAYNISLTKLKLWIELKKRMKYSAVMGIMRELEKRAEDERANGKKDEM